MMFLSECYFDLNGKTFLMGKFVLRTEDLSYYPEVEILDAFDYNQPCGYLSIFNISSKICRPLPGVFESPSDISRTILETVVNGDLKQLILRPTRHKSKGDMLEII